VAGVPAVCSKLIVAGTFPLAPRLFEEPPMPASRHPSPAGKRAVVTLAAALMAALIAASARSEPAQAPDGPPAAWRVECTGDGKTLDCRAVQQVFQRETRQLLVSLVVRPAADAKTGAMILQLPLGLNLTEPILVKVDNGTAEKQPIQTCTNVGCFVAMTVADKLLAAMRTGSVLHITVQDANKKSIDITLPLLGFGLAFDKAK
jgi:invasion protein IalB